MQKKFADGYSECLYYITIHISSRGGLGGKRTTMFTQAVTYMNLWWIESRLGHKIWLLMHPLFMSTDVCYMGV